MYKKAAASTVLHERIGRSIMENCRNLDGAALSWLQTEWCSTSCWIKCDSFTGNCALWLWQKNVLCPGYWSWFHRAKVHSSWSTTAAFFTIGGSAVWEIQWGNTMWCGCRARTILCERKTATCDYVCVDGNTSELAHRCVEWQGKQDEKKMWKS